MDRRARSGVAAPARRRGFTLTDLLVAAAIVSGAAALALPSYGAYMRRGQLSEAFPALSRLRVEMERYHRDHGRYGREACADDAFPGQALFPLDVKGFSVTCALVAGGQGFRLTATGKGMLTIGYAYTIDDAGAAGTTRFSDADARLPCWATRSRSVCDL